MARWGKIGGKVAVALARLDVTPPDWGQVGTAVGSVLAAAALAILAKFGSKRNEGPLPPERPRERPPSATDQIAHDGDIAVNTLQSLILTLQGENQRLWARIAELEERDDDREARQRNSDNMLRNLQGELSRLRSLLVRNGIDPGGEL